VMGPHRWDNRDGNRWQLDWRVLHERVRSNRWQIDSLVRIRLEHLRDQVGAIRIDPIGDFISTSRDVLEEYHDVACHMEWVLSNNHDIATSEFGDWVRRGGRRRGAQQGPEGTHEHTVKTWEKEREFARSARSLSRKHGKSGT